MCAFTGDILGYGQVDGWSDWPPHCLHDTYICGRRHTLELATAVKQGENIDANAKGRLHVHEVVQ